MDNESDADSDVCARCATASGTCCTLAPGNEEYCFPLSASERVRMEGAGAEALHFFRQANTAPFVDNLCRLFPGESETIRGLFPNGGEHDRLAIGAGGACLLLGPQGCLLPRDARPLYCRLFPFWMRSGRELYFQFDRCRAQQEAGGGGPGLMLRLGTSSAEIQTMYHELRRAWGLPEQT
ncbi:MAG: zinc/iron-chelating domain-containing protein [Desulfovibrio sp.]|jgi:Fe-S-cluster containining protein|nr:zinc/iron-chelating domain-containing protein [Desulfovibrio sp.]